MKKSKEETAKTRERIVEVAAKEFRRNGINSTGVAEIMAAAGLTQGGFYRHFASKDQLVAEACGCGMRAVVGSYRQAVESGGDVFLKQLEKHLSMRGEEAYLEGCPIVFLGSELARANMETRKAVSEGYRELVNVIMKSERYKDNPSARAEAIFTLSAMVGAATISRIADDPKLSALILDETRRHLAAQIRKASSPKHPRKQKATENTKRATG